MIKSPLNYIGGKGKLLSQLLPLFPKKINTFIDLFAGGCNVGINVNSNRLIFNDNLIYLIDMYVEFKKRHINDILFYVENRINELSLSLTNQQGYLQLRQEYNEQRHPLDLFVLIAYSFNHQIRFNNNHQFNNPFGKERSAFNERMKENLVQFIQVLQKKEVLFTKQSFDQFDFSCLTRDDFIYCDPPYLITMGTYNDGKRGFKGWGIREEEQLLIMLDQLNNKGFRFALSNVLEHKGKENTILKDWLKNKSYAVHYLNKHYANSSYNTRDRRENSSREVLITNYINEAPIQYEIHWE